MEAFVEAFFTIDTNNSCKITAKELSNYMKAQNYDDAFVKVKIDSLQLSWY